MHRRFVLLWAAALIPSLVLAQETWEERKAARLKPVTQQQREAIAAAVPDQLAAKPTADRRILVFYRSEGFIHTSIPHGNVAVEEMAKQTDAFDVDFADSYDVFTDENLQKYDAILLNNTTHMQFPNPSQLNAFMDFISNGGGLIGFHAASDNFGRHPEARSIVGGQFAGHPWNAGGTWAFKLDDPDHTLNEAFGGQGFWHQDEIYQYDPKTYVGPETLRILVSLDMSKQAVSKQIDDGPREVPVSWLRKAGKGRVFYTNLGHREETYQHPAIMQHMLDGIQYALGDLQADATPTAKVANETAALAPAK